MQMRATKSWVQLYLNTVRGVIIEKMRPECLSLITRCQLRGSVSLLPAERGGRRGNLAYFLVLYQKIPKWTPAVSCSRAFSRKSARHVTVGKAQVWIIKLNILVLRMLDHCHGLPRRMNRTVLLATPVLFWLWGVKMSAVENADSIRHLDSSGK